MTVREDRQIDSRFAGYFLEAASDEIGAHSLRLVVGGAGLERFAADPQSGNGGLIIKASEYAGLHEAIRRYYGSGARGTLIRIGRSVWQRILANATLFERITLQISRILPPFSCSQQILGFLARKMRQPEGDVSVHLLDNDLIFMDTSSDATFGQTAAEPVCWFTLGILQAALFWATGREQDVEEISCRAEGAVACRFQIHL